MVADTHKTHPLLRHPARAGAARRGGALLRLLPAIALLLTGHPAWAGADQTAPMRRAARKPAPPLGPNLLVNGDFERGFEGWTLEQIPGSAKAQLELVSEKLPSEVPGQAARVRVTAIGSEPWHVQFYQRGLDLQDRQTYVAAFWARADRERTMAAAANIFGGDGHGIGLYVDGLRLDHMWKKFNLAFTATRTQAEQNRLTLVLGGAAGTVDLAGLSVRTWEPEERPGSNLLKNPDFGLGTTHWILEQGAEGSSATFECTELTDAPSELSGKAARLQVEKIGAQPWHVQLAQPALDLLEGVPHVVTFWARAERPRSLSVEAAVDMPDWHSVGLASRVPLTEQWQRFRLAFTPSRTIAEHGRLVFVLGEAPGRVEIGRVYIGKQTLAPSEAGVHPLIGRWSTPKVALQPASFTFNEDGTGSLLVGLSATARKGAPRAPVANPFRWYIGKGAADVVIAGRLYRWAIKSRGNTDELRLGNDSGQSYTLYRDR